MKNLIATGLCCLLFASCSTSPGKMEKEEYAFVHGTYSVDSRLKSKQEIDKSGFRDFQFVYLMAGPRWEIADFDLPQPQIDDKYVHRHTYPVSEADGVALVPYLIDKVHADGSKILVSFPGTTFDQIVSDEGRRMKFASMMGEFVSKYNYDGIELDWEKTVDLTLHYLFMRDIREVLDEKEQHMKKPLYLTSALNFAERYTQAQADSVSKYVDFLNVMMYDMGGGIWDKVATYNTPLQLMKDYSARWDVFDPQKICIGLASYGFYYKGIQPGETTEKTLNNYGRYMDYNELPPLLQQGWTEEYNPLESVSYFFSPDKKEFVTMDNERSLKAKMDWIAGKHYKGVFWWEFHSDFQYPESGPGDGTHALMDYVTGLIGD